MAGPAQDKDLGEHVCRILAGAEPGPVLQAVLRTTIALTGAERGFVVVRDPAEAAGFRVEAAEGIDLARAPERQLSATLVRRVLESGRPLVLENACESEYAEARSVARLGLLSVAVAPFARDGEVSGAVYLDTRLLRSVFGPTTLARLTDLIDRLIAPLHQLAGQARLEASAGRDLARLKERLGMPDFLGADSRLVPLLHAVACAAPTNASVLIMGESGTGKERLARALHENSPRRAGPFVAVNCGALPEGLAESELFGHEKGAFTGAAERAEGRVAAADGGTLFLDEVAELPLPVQVALLRLLESGEVQRVGRPRPLLVDVRIVAATHRDLDALRRSGAFRDDLFWRLAVIPLRVPPLRQRGQDTVILAGAFLAQLAGELGKPGLRLGPAAVELLARHSFPGNVRELRNLVRRAAIFAADEVRPEHFGELGAEPGEAAAVPRTRDELARAKDEAGARLERRFLEHVLGEAKGSVAEAARAAGINRTYLHELIQRHGLDPAAFRKQP